MTPPIFSTNPTTQTLPPKRSPIYIPYPQSFPPSFAAMPLNLQYHNLNLAIEAMARDLLSSSFIRRDQVPEKGYTTQAQSRTPLKNQDSNQDQNHSVRDIPKEKSLDEVATNPLKSPSKFPSEFVPNLDPQRIQRLESYDPVVCKILAAAKIICSYDSTFQEALIPPYPESKTSKRIFDSSLSLWRRNIHWGDDFLKTRPSIPLRERPMEESMNLEIEVFSSIFEEIKKKSLDKLLSTSSDPSNPSDPSPQSSPTKDDIEHGRYLSRIRQILFGMATPEYQRIFFNSLKSTHKTRSIDLQNLIHFQIEFTEDRIIEAMKESTTFKPSIELQGFPKY